MQRRQQEQAIVAPNVPASPVDFARAIRTRVEAERLRTITAHTIGDTLRAAGRVRDAVYVSSYL